MSGRRKLIQAAVFAALVVVMMLALIGRFQRKVPSHAAAESPRSASGASLVKVRRVAVPAVEAAVGTITPVYETTISSRVLARVVEVRVKAGQAVREGDLLVRLDDADLKARLAQARAELAAATAEDEQARRDLARSQKLHEKSALTDVDWERAQTRAKAAAAQVERARQAGAEAQANLAFVEIRAARAATVVDKQVDVGDVVRPGMPLVALYDPSRMQLVGTVREALAAKLRVGQRVRIELASAEGGCDAEVTEVVPESDAKSRSFTVKAVGACAHAWKGMFGRLLIPLADEDVLVVPTTSVAHVGQLDLVDVAENGELVRRIVQLGRPTADGKSVQVLSGLKEGEEVAEAPAGAPKADG